MSLVFPELPAWLLDDVPNFEFSTHTRSNVFDGLDERGTPVSAGPFPVSPATNQDLKAFLAGPPPAAQPNEAELPQADTADAATWIPPELAPFLGGGNMLGMPPSTGTSVASDFTSASGPPAAPLMPGDAFGLRGGVSHAPSSYAPPSEPAMPQAPPDSWRWHGNREESDFEGYGASPYRYPASGGRRESARAPMPPAAPAPPAPVLSPNGRNVLMPPAGGTYGEVLPMPPVGYAPAPSSTVPVWGDRRFAPYVVSRQESPKERAPARARPFPCTFCSRAFSRKHDLERHARVHSGDRPYVCQVCKKGFPRSDALRRHIRVERCLPQGQGDRGQEHRRDDRGDTGHSDARRSASPPAARRSTPAEQPEHGERADRAERADRSD